MPPRIDLKGSCAVVTGSGRGIGRALALALGGRDCRVALIARSQAELDETATMIRSSGGEAAVFPADLSSIDSIPAVLSAVRGRFGPPAVLVNNAGRAPSAPLGRTTDELWDATLELDLVAPFVLGRELIPDMKSAGFGRIVNIASTAGLKGYAYTGAYAAAKHGLVGLTRAWSRELVAHGITVNAVCPGFVDSALTRDAVRNIVRKTGKSEEEARRALAAENPLGRLVRPEEVAEAAMVFFGPDSDCLSGQALAVAAGAVEG